MHAVATDEGSGNRPCLYLQLDDGEDDCGFGGGGDGGSSSSEEEDGNGVQAELLPELRLVPADASERALAAKPCCPQHDGMPCTAPHRRPISPLTSSCCFPACPSAVETIFQAFCEGAERNPDWSGEAAWFLARRVFCCPALCCSLPLTSHPPVNCTHRRR